MPEAITPASSSTSTAPSAAPEASAVATPAAETHTGNTGEVSSSDALDSAIREKLASDGIDINEDSGTRSTEQRESVAPNAAAVATTDEVDELAQALGITFDPKNREHGWKTRLPYSKVKKVVAELQKKAKDAHEAAIAEHTGKVTTYEQRLADVAKAEELMASDPARFLQVLQTIHPAYGDLLSGKSETSGQKHETGQTEMPQPDLKFADGTFGYSADATQKLLKWQTQQTETSLRQQFAPVLNAYEAEQRIAAAAPQVQAQLQEAATWPLFNEHQAEIVAALQADKRLSLEGAWRKVVVPKLQSERTKVRQEVLDEINKQPRSTSTSTTTAAAKPEPTMDLDAQIRAKLKQDGISLGE